MLHVQDEERFWSAMEQVGVDVDEDIVRGVAAIAEARDLEWGETIKLLLRLALPIEAARIEEERE